MNIDRARISSYLLEIEGCRRDLETWVRSDRLNPGSLELKAAKYTLVVAAEAITGTLQHLLARTRGIAVGGYLDTLAKARDEGMLSEGLSARLRPFLEFRNSLVHRYWIVDDLLLGENIRQGYRDFSGFAEEVRSFVSGLEPGGE